MVIKTFYRKPGLHSGKLSQVLKQISSITGQPTSLDTETCYYVELKDKDVSLDDKAKIEWLLSHGFDAPVQTHSSFEGDKSLIIEIGPRLNFSTPFSTNAVSIFYSIGLTGVTRVEKSTRYLISTQSECSSQIEEKLVAALHDKMTECRYVKPITSFQLPIEPQPWSEVRILEEGRPALERISKELGLSFDDWDLDYYTNLFAKELKKNPTTVECFDLAQSNSEHSRHWFFKGRLIVDGKEIEKPLFQMIMETQEHSAPNNVIKFSDNSSAIKGYKVDRIIPDSPGRQSSFSLENQLQHIIFTAETHNFPTGVAPFSGAATGTGGRIRDVHAAGKGAHVVAGTAGYSFGNLNIPGYDLPWEDKDAEYPSNFASPLSIAIEASNGASDYGNKFGEPIIAGFARSFGLKLPDGTRREYIKPIMFTGGLGRLNGGMELKDPPEKGMFVVKLGGPVYRIGVGGGSASSVHVQGDQKEELDFGAVQRGDAEMEQKLNRVIRACIEMGPRNLICSIHDQGAGGNGNVLKEIVEPAGAEIYLDYFHLGDPTLSDLEIWGAEYQESDAILIRPEDCKELFHIGIRERCYICIVGEITGDGRIVLKDSPQDTKDRHPVDLSLHHVLGSMPRKVFHLDTHAPLLHPLTLPTSLSVRHALDRVLRLPSVASKRYLTNKVDRSVTGLIAQQQCVGPLHTPLADVAVTALSHWGCTGAATSIGEQPIKGLLDPAAGARMSVAEALTNLVFAKVSQLKDVKCSGNWMWAAKLPGEGAALYQACRAMSEVMSTLGVAIDGGKDSLSMAARVGGKTVKAPGTLVISAYVSCPDVNLTVTPDLKVPNKKGALLYIDLSSGKGRLGGSALAQVFSQLGDDVSDLDNPELLRDAFNILQSLIEEKRIFAGHDVSDGGLITCILEMAFAGNCGVHVNIHSSLPSSEIMGLLFGEEAGWVIEVSQHDVDPIVALFKEHSISCQYIGDSSGFGPTSEIFFSVGGEVVLKDKMTTLRDIWEETSFQLERLQANPECVAQEQQGLSQRTAPPFHLTFDPASSLSLPGRDPSPLPRVAVLREEGTNGDLEMVASLYAAGFEVWDLTMSDLVPIYDNDYNVLSPFKGLVFPGGFSYADVLGSARGWAAGLLFNESLRKQFDAFYKDPRTFSLGVCNGCQLMGLLGWVAPKFSDKREREQGVLLTHNKSERFESRFSACRIEKSQSIMLQGMEGSILGVWVAHGEGRFEFKTSSIAEAAETNVALRYVDDAGNPTEVYPLNPNGSPGGIAGLCSPCGRHLAMMPHPERCTQLWQWPYLPPEWKDKITVSPWMRMFSNAFSWVVQQSEYYYWYK